MLHHEMWEAQHDILILRGEIVCDVIKNLLLVCVKCLFSDSNLSELKIRKSTSLIPLKDEPKNIRVSAFRVS